MSKASPSELECALHRIGRLRKTLETSDKLLMEANHVLLFARNKGVANDRLKERIRQHLTREE